MTWRLAKSLEVLRAQIDHKWPARDKSSDGTIGDEKHQARKSEHNPDPITGTVRALDITNDPAHGVTARAIAEALINSRDPRILYVISNAQYAGPGTRYKDWDWHPYTGENAHRQHCHISVQPAAELYDAETPWAAIDGAVTAPATAQPARRFTNIVATVFGPRSNADQRTAYADVEPGWASRPGCALPMRFKGKRPTVRGHYQGKSVDMPVVDVGPWNIDDDYVLTGARPRAESGTDSRGRHTNRAGIDLTPAAAEALGLQGKGAIDFEILDGLAPAPSTPAIATTGAIAAGTGAAVLAYAGAYPKPAAFVVGLAAAGAWQLARHFFNNGADDMATASGKATVDLKPAWKSKINWTQLIGAIGTIGTLVDIVPMNPATKATVIGGIALATQVATYIQKTFFTDTVTPSSVGR